MNGMTPDPLANLADIHLPPPVAAFPWAWGWWLLLALSAALLLTLLWWGLRRRRRNAFRRAALAELHTLRSCPQDRELATAVNQLLRRVARHSLGSQGLGATGSAWRSCINQAATPASSIDEELLAMLEEAAYRPDTRPLDRERLFAQVSRWIRRHREVKR